MNEDKKLLVKKNIESIISNIRSSSIEYLDKNNVTEIPKNILLEYYNLITNIISNQSLTIYLLHIISREINNSSSLLEKEILLSLLPEFYVPFMNTDISLTDSYLSRILTSIQSNILSEISPIYIGEIYKRIIIIIFNEDEEANREIVYKELFEICQGFCLYNMKQNQYNYQLCGIICLNYLLKEIDLSFLNINSYMLDIWEKIDFFLNWKNFAPKEYLLKYIYDLISKFKTAFKPYVNISIYQILGFIDNKNTNIRKNALNILSLLISFYPDEIKPIKESIIQLLSILKSDKDENIRNKAVYINNKIEKQNTTTIYNQRNNNSKLFFYNLENSSDYKKNKTESKIINRINNKRIVTRKPKFITNINTRNNSKEKERETFEPHSRNGGIVNLRQNSCKNYENNSKFFIRRIKKESSENKRYFGYHTSNNSKKKYDKHNDINKSNYECENEIGFRDLLNIVKRKSDKKRILNNNFSNLRDEIKKNNNGLNQIRRIKSEKVIKGV